MSDLNKDLIEQLLQRIDLLEKEMKHHKKAKKDYDKDGKVESSEEEYLGSRDRAIKKAQGKIEEGFGEN
jgi:ABC-type phosphate/phosphonate transport system substrate-binding protein